jgi:hypothetical protein
MDTPNKMRKIYGAVTNTIQLNIEPILTEEGDNLQGI